MIKVLNIETWKSVNNSEFLKCYCEVAASIQNSITCNTYEVVFFYFHQFIQIYLNFISTSCILSFFFVCLLQPKQGQKHDADEASFNRLVNNYRSKLSASSCTGSKWYDSWAVKVRYCVNRVRTLLNLPPNDAAYSRLYSYAPIQQLRRKHLSRAFWTTRHASVRRVLLLSFYC